MAKQVRALKDGFYGGNRRREGAVFSIPDKAELGSWMEEVKTKEAPAAKKATTQEPEALKGDESYEDLRKRAKAHALTFDGTPNKEQLIKAIKQAEGVKESDDLA